jgi:hypothetical protein
MGGSAQNVEHRITWTTFLQLLNAKIVTIHATFEMENPMNEINMIFDTLTTGLAVIVFAAFCGVLWLAFTENKRRG